MRHCLFALVASGCSTPTDSADSAEPSGPPTIVILEPEADATVCSTSFHVRLQIENLTLVDPYAPPDPPLPNTGHVDVTLNGLDVAMIQGEDLDVVDAQTGFEYQLRAELSNADHSPIEPYAGDFIYIHAEESGCSL
ncbi:MAG: hypothetical protein EXR71_11855 [Myxococcales bacterium]|nr:hypothetical protein [Myxococcales bacterium]